MNVLKEKLTEMMAADRTMLLQKGLTYGDSWKKRGGVGAYMMLARKWDRIEEAAKKNNWDIFKAILNEEELIDDIIDLGNYLYLVRSEGYQYEPKITDIGSEPLSTGYVNQDGDDVFNKMAADHAMKVIAPKPDNPLNRMGDTEILAYMEVVFAKPHSSEVETFTEQRRDLLLNLHMFHGAIMTRQKPHRELADIMDSNRFVLSFMDPYRAEN